MGNCFGKTNPLDVETTTKTTTQQLSSSVTGAYVPPSEQSCTRPVRGSLQNAPPVRKLRKAVSAPPNAQSTKDSANSLLSPPLSVRALSESSVASSSRPTSAATPRPPAAHYPIRRLTSTVGRVLPDHFKFRILVVGKSRSGKSSLIKAVFKVDITAASERGLRGTDINFEYCPKDNRYLIFHECSGLESRAGDSQNIRDFISYRTDMNCSASDKLHAVWICVPASDAISGELGKGAKEILGMRGVPVILVFTKFDVVVTQALFDTPRDDEQRHERARAKALAMYEDSCRRLFHQEPRDVPAEVVSEKPRDVDLIEKLVVTTDSFILGSRGPSAAGFGIQGGNPRVSTVPLAWSAALRVSHDIVVQASIEVGRRRYWHRLWSSVDFADHTLRSCVNIIHTDLVEIWNLNDKSRYLSNDGFKAEMSHLVKDLAGSANMLSDPYVPGSGVGFADWVQGVYRGSQKNVRCVMGYVVGLTVILDAIFCTTSGDISPQNVLLAIDRHFTSSKKDKIHRDIREFVPEAFALRFSVPHKDLILDKIIDLIQEFCVPPTGNSWPADLHLTNSHVERRHIPEK
ncbi:hypothetical protein EDB86DRAFT_2941602 [Lactarius hatsudake]|nr:hypothetical protein EDB86DRAFT_2941602 [Lactarius hatsudake]